MFLSRCGAFLTLKAFVVTSLVPSFLFATGPNRDDEDLKITAVYKEGQAPHQPSLFEECQQLAGGGANGSTTPVVASVPRPSVVVKQEPGVDENLAAAVTNSLFAGAFNAGPAIPTHITPDAASPAASDASDDSDATPDATPNVTAAQPFLTVDYNAFGPGAPPAPKIVPKTPARASIKRSLEQTKKTPQQPGQLKRKRLTRKPKGKAPLHKRTDPYATRSSQTASQTSTHKPQPAVQAAATPMDVDDASSNPGSDIDFVPPVGGSDTSNVESATQPAAANQIPAILAGLSDAQREALHYAKNLAETSLAFQSFMVTTNLSFGLLPGHRLNAAQQQALQQYKNVIHLDRRKGRKPSTHTGGVENNVFCFFESFALRAYLNYFGRSLDAVLERESFDPFELALCSHFLKNAKSSPTLLRNRFLRSFLSLCDVDCTSRRGYKYLRINFYNHDSHNILQAVHDLLQTVDWQEQVAAMQANNPAPPVFQLPTLESFDAYTKARISESNAYTHTCDLWPTHAEGVFVFMRKCNKDFKFLSDQQNLFSWLAHLCCSSDTHFADTQNFTLDNTFDKSIKMLVIWCLLSQTGLLPAADEELSAEQSVQIQKEIVAFLAPFLKTDGKYCEKGTDHTITFLSLYNCFVSANRLGPRLHNAKEEPLLKWLMARDLLVDRPDTKLSFAQEMLLRRCMRLMSNSSNADDYRQIASLHDYFETSKAHALTAPQKEKLKTFKQNTENLFKIELTEQMKKDCAVRPEVQELCHFYLLDAYLKIFGRTLDDVIGATHLDEITKSVLKPLSKEGNQGEGTLVIKDVNLVRAFFYAHWGSRYGSKSDSEKCFLALDGWVEEVAATEKNYPPVPTHRYQSLKPFDEQAKANVLLSSQNPLSDAYITAFCSQVFRLMRQQNKVFNRPQHYVELAQWVRDLGLAYSDLFPLRSGTQDAQTCEKSLQEIVLTCMLGQYGVLKAQGAAPLTPQENAAKRKAASEFLEHFAQPYHLATTVWYVRPKKWLDFRPLLRAFFTGNNLSIDHTPPSVQTTLILIPWLERHGFIVTTKPEAAQATMPQATSQAVSQTPSSHVSTVRVRAAPAASAKPTQPAQAALPQTAFQFQPAMEDVRKRRQNHHHYFVSLQKQHENLAQCQNLLNHFRRLPIGPHTPTIRKQIMDEALSLKQIILQKYVRLSYPGREQHAAFYASQDTNRFDKIHLKNPTMGPTLALKKRWPEIPFEGTLYLENVNKLDPFLMNTLCALPGVKALNVSYASRPFTMDRSINVCSESLEKLSLQNIKLESAFLKLCTQLTSLDLDNIMLMGPSFKDFPPLEKLERLSLDSCHWGADMLPWIGKMSALKELVLEKSLTSSGVDQFSFLKNMPNLVHLDLMYNVLQASDLQGLKHLQNLQILAISDSHLDQGVIEAIVQNTHLSHLMLNRCGLTHQSIQPLKQAICNGKLPDIQWLSLGGNKLCADDLTFIHQLPQLQRLSIVDAAQGYRLLPLFNYQALYRLHLTQTGLILEDIQRLCQNIKQHLSPTKKWHLVLSHNPLQMDALEALRTLWHSFSFDGEIVVHSACVTAKELNAFRGALHRDTMQARQAGRTLQPFVCSAGYWTIERLASLNCELQNGHVVRKASAPKAFDPATLDLNAALDAASAAPAQTEDAAGPAPMNVDNSATVPTTADL